MMGRRRRLAAPPQESHLPLSALRPSVLGPVDLDIWPFGLHSSENSLKNAPQQMLRNLLPKLPTFESLNPHKIIGSVQYNDVQKLSENIVDRHGCGLRRPTLLQVDSRYTGKVNPFPPCYNELISQFFYPALHVYGILHGVENIQCGRLSQLSWLNLPHWPRWYLCMKLKSSKGPSILSFPEASTKYCNLFLSAKNIPLFLYLHQLRQADNHN